MFHLYNFWKHEKAFSFQMFTGVIDWNIGWERVKGFYVQLGLCYLMFWM